MRLSLEFHPNESDASQEHYRVSVHRTTIGDNVKINRERRELAEKYSGSDEMLAYLYNFPLLRHSGTFEVFTEEAWQKADLNEERFLSLPDVFVMDWLNLIYEINPQYSVLQLEFLKNVVSGLSGKNENIEDAQTANAEITPN